MQGYKLIICEVPHNKAEVVSQAAVNAGSFGGTVLMGRSISSNGVAAFLGFGETTVEIVYILTEDSQVQEIYSAIIKALENEKSNFGKIFITDVSEMAKTGKTSGGNVNMQENTGRELIVVILNKGYADDAMAAARKAGAGGGTVVNARGTAKEDDAKFFGVHIVPEKEMLMIVVDSQKKQEVMDSIKTLPCLSEPGSGIVFCMPVLDFNLLGKN